MTITIAKLSATKELSSMSGSPLHNLGIAKRASLSCLLTLDNLCASN
jgi:hypothetical protein